MLCRIEIAYIPRKAADMPETITAEAWRSLHREWLWVYRGLVPRTDVWSSEVVVPAGVFFVESGEGRICVGGEEIIVRRGDAFFSAPGPRRQWFAAGTRLLSVGFRCQWPDGRPIFRSGLNVAAKSPKLRVATLGLFRSVHRSRKTVTFREAVKPMARSLTSWASHEAAFQGWFAAWIDEVRKLGVEPEPRIAKGRRSRVSQIVAWLDAVPLHQTTLGLPPSFPLGQRRTDQLLQEELGISMRAYFENRRLDAARERILAEDISLKEIAFALGFRHASHFTAWFRRHTGVSPSAYRQGGVEAA